jgi:hypothetical protein
MQMQNSGSKTASKNKADNSKPVVIDFGNRTVSDQNFSKVVALPKPALTNCGDDVRHVNVKLVQTGTEKYLKLTPVQTSTSTKKEVNE